MATVLVLTTIAALACAAVAQANEAQTIIEKCGHGEPIGGHSQSAYRDALKHMPTEVSEYTDCANQIRKAALAAAGGGVSASGSGTPNVALPLSPAEQRAVQSAHSKGSTPVRIGNEPIRPGVVHADIASAVNTLPHSLLAAIVLIVVGALASIVMEGRRLVRARRDG